MKLVCISDTHTKENKLKLPAGDILIHAGDSEIRSLEELELMNTWFGKQDFKYKILIMGNHDLYSEKLSKESLETILTNVIYLENSSVTIEGIKFWGSPYSPIFQDWSYMAHGERLNEIWNTIPEDTDVVITHCPPYTILDYVAIGYFHHVGCPYLRKRIKKIKPKYHIFGHIHDSHGVYQDKYTTYINASLLDDCYQLVYKPIIVDI